MSRGSVLPLVMVVQARVWETIQGRLPENYSIHSNLSRLSLCVCVCVVVGGGARRVGDLPQW